VSSIVLPLLAAAVAVIPSKQPAPDTPGPVHGWAAVSVTITPAARILWSQRAAGAFSQPSAEGHRVVRRTVKSGEIRYDVDLQ
jgi:hypothetical protein